ncbi:hypothetical protein KC347_g211 [Hortaea werneckii]|nr:hypothetical protein KC347_g211 [Hortaea werneckii]
MEAFANGGGNAHTTTTTTTAGFLSSRSSASFVSAPSSTLGADGPAPTTTARGEDSARILGPMRVVLVLVLVVLVDWPTGSISRRRASGGGRVVE